MSFEKNSGSSIREGERRGTLARLVQAADDSRAGDKEVVTPPKVRRLPLDDAVVTEAVLTAAREGDRDAWERLYHLYSRHLFGFLMMRLSHTDDAGEALSETYLRAIEKLGTFRGNASSLRPWLFAIARNVAIDRLRGRKRLHPQAEIADLVDLTALEPGDRLIIGQERTAVGLAFGQLPADDREVLWLRFGEGLTSAEVAKVVGKRPGAVRMQQMRALQALATEVEQ